LINIDDIRVRENAAPHSRSDTIELVSRLEPGANIDKVEQDEGWRAVSAERGTTVRMGENPVDMAGTKTDVSGETAMKLIREGTHEGTALVVDASSRSGMITPSPIGMIFSFSEWLMRYMWSSVASGPWMRLTEQGNDALVTEKGVSQI
jgi:hypothetical protein